MTPLNSTIISVAFLAAGAVCFGTMTLRIGSPGAGGKGGVLLHRLCGWIFVLLYLYMTWFMVLRLRTYWEEPAPLTTMHITLSVALFLILLLKVAIPRRLPGLAKHLFGLGTSVMVIAFSLVGISGGYFLVRTVEGMPYVSHDDTDGPLDAALGQTLLITRCSTCHILKEVLARRSPEAWEQVLNRMMRIAAPRITPGEGRQILHYLVTRRSA